MTAIKTQFEELQQLMPELPESVRQDISDRISDWLLSGGDIDDPYISAQLRYAKAVIKRMEEEKT